jgi:hypothetical protein
MHRLLISVAVIIAALVLVLVVIVLGNADSTEEVLPFMGAVISVLVFSGLQIAVAARLSGSYFTLDPEGEPVLPKGKVDKLAEAILSKLGVGHVLSDIIGDVIAEVVDPKSSVPKAKEIDFVVDALRQRILTINGRPGDGPNEARLAYAVANSTPVRYEVVKRIEEKYCEELENDGCTSEG